jgi:hypothetical protein
VKKAVVLLLGTGVVAAVVFRKQIADKFNGIRIVVEDQQLTPLEVLEVLRDKIAEAKAAQTSYSSSEN